MQTEFIKIQNCRGLFRKFEILPVPCQYVLSLMLFIIDNPNKFRTGLEIHGLHTRSRNQLFITIAHLTNVQKGITLWGHSQLVSHINPFTALFRAQYNNCTSVQIGPFQGSKSCPFQGLDQWFQPITRQFILTNHRSVF